MRFKKREQKVGQIIQRTKFLWFPVSINGETRWLERATIEYESYQFFDTTSGYDGIAWRPLRFVN